MHLCLLLRLGELCGDANVLERLRGDDFGDVSGKAVVGALSSDDILSLIEFDDVWTDMGGVGEIITLVMISVCWIVLVLPKLSLSSLKKKNCIILSGVNGELECLHLGV